MFAAANVVAVVAAAACIPAVVVEQAAVAVVAVAVGYKLLASQITSKLEVVVAPVKRAEIRRLGSGGKYYCWRKS